MYLEKFEKFLGTINLEKYREKYQPIKIVEMDLDRDIISVYFIIEVYWNKRDFIPFEKFYELFLDKYKRKLEKFRRKVIMCKKCFYLGMEARVYRTWASILTQIQAGFIAEQVFGKNKVIMTGELDVEKSVDFQIIYNNKKYNIHIKKISQSREVRQERPKPKKPLEGEHIKLNYLVWVPGKTTHDKEGSPRKWFLDSQEIFSGNRLPNGFIVFKKEYFEKLKNAIDANTLKENNYFYYEDD